MIPLNKEALFSLMCLLVLSSINHFVGFYKEEYRSKKEKNFADFINGAFLLSLLTLGLSMAANEWTIG